MAAIDEESVASSPKEGPPVTVAPTHEESASTPETAIPMLDVHTPHEAARSWKDFFIHIATISVGLLIAIGLEQAVESFHQHHERHQLEEDLHQEGLRNREIAVGSIAYLDTRLAFFVDLHQQIRAAKAGQANVMWPPPPLKDATGQSPRYSAPTAAVWNTAKENGAIALLPAREAREYTRLYGYYDTIIESYLEYRRTNIAVLSVTRDLSPTGDSRPELSALSSAELDELSRSGMQSYAAIHELQDEVRSFRAANDAVLDGVSTDEEIVAAVFAEIGISSSPK